MYDRCRTHLLISHLKLDLENFTFSIRWQELGETPSDRLQGRLESHKRGECPLRNVCPAPIHPSARLTSTPQLIDFGGGLH